MIQYICPIGLTLLLSWVVFALMLLIDRLSSNREWCPDNNPVLVFIGTLLMMLTCLFIAIFIIWGIGVALVWIWKPYL